MKISEQKQGAVIVIKPEGPLTHAEAQDLKAHLSRELGSSLGRVVIDMSEIPFVDSAGLEVLVEITEQLGKSGQTLKICSPNNTLREVLTITDLSSMFDHFDDVTTAVRSFM